VSVRFLIKLGRLALCRLLDIVEEGRVLALGLNDLSLTDLALKAAGLARATLQTEELSLHRFGIGGVVRNSSLRAFLDWLHREADLLCVLKELSAVDWLVLVVFLVGFLTRTEPLVITAFLRIVLIALLE